MIAVLTNQKIPLIEEGLLRSATNHQLPPRRHSGAQHRRTPGVAEKHQSEEPPKGREDGLIWGDAAFHPPHKPPLPPPEQNRKENRTEDAQDLADEILIPTPILHIG
jgi:hypothetical protein